MDPWLAGFAGGLIIGIAAAAFLLVNGRVLGVSGVLGGIVDGSGRGSLGESIALLAGMALVPAIAAAIAGGTETGLTANPVLLVLGGLAVGLGTRLAFGCTSGHGVCGVARLSRRGLTATVTFVGAGFVTMALLRGVLGVI